MFEDFIKSCPMRDIEKVPRQRIKADRAAVWSRIKQEDAMYNNENKLSRSRVRMRFAAVAAAVFAAVCLTVTASAAIIGFDFKNFFTDNREKIQPYIVNDCSFEVVENTFEDYDIELTGAALDDHLFYVGFDMIAKDVPAVEYFKDSSFYINDENLGCSYEIICNGSDNERSSFFIRGFSDAKLTDGRATLVFSGLYRKDKGFLKSGDELVEGKIKINIDLEKSRTFDIDVNETMTVPVMMTKGKEDSVLTDMQWYVSSVCVSGMSVVMNVEHESTINDYPADGEKQFINYSFSFADDKGVSYLKLKNGQKVMLTEHSSYGKSLSDDNREVEVINLVLETPVDAELLDSLVIGENVIPII